MIIGKCCYGRKCRGKRGSWRRTTVGKSPNVAGRGWISQRSCRTCPWDRHSYFDTEPWWRYVHKYVSIIYCVFTWFIQIWKVLDFQLLALELLENEFCLEKYLKINHSPSKVLEYFKTFNTCWNDVKSAWISCPLICMNHDYNGWLYEKWKYNHFVEYMYQIT